MHDEQGDLAVLGMAEGAVHAANDDEADPLIAPDGGLAELGARGRLPRDAVQSSSPIAGS
jgi:hypothetical protein